MDNKSEIQKIQNQIQELNGKIKMLEIGRSDVSIAAKVVHDFEQDNNLEHNVLKRNLLNKLMQNAREIGYTGTEAAIRAAYLSRKYWVRMENDDWSLKV